MDEWVLLGGGGHARSVVAALRGAGAEIRGYLAPEPSTSLDGVPHLGDDGQLDRLDPAVLTLAIGLGSVSATGGRRALYEYAVHRRFTVGRVIHTRAFVDPGARLAQGVQVLAGAVVNVGAELAENVLVNSGAIVEHDCRVGAHTHIAPGAVLAGGVLIGEGAHIGLGARVLQSITIGSGSVVGAGAVVTEDVPAETTVAGVPARALRK